MPYVLQNKKEEWARQKMLERKMEEYCLILIKWLALRCGKENECKKEIEFTAWWLNPDIQVLYGGMGMAFIFVQGALETQ